MVKPLRIAEFEVSASISPAPPGLVCLNACFCSDGISYCDELPIIGILATATVGIGYSGGHCDAVHLTDLCGMYAEPRDIRLKVIVWDRGLGGLVTMDELDDSTNCVSDIGFPGDEEHKLRLKNEAKAKAMNYEAKRLAKS